MRKYISGILFAIFAAAAVLAAWQLCSILLEYKAAEDSYEALTQYVHLPEAPEAAAEKQETALPPEQQGTDAILPAKTQDAIQWPVVDFDALWEINPDVAAWFYIEGTEIHYPVVQGEDNSYYLTHRMDGERSSAGSLFLDCDNAGDFSDRNSIIYGHHMKNGSMFEDLIGYKQQEFYEAHPYALLITPEKNCVVEFFSAYVAPENGNSWQIQFQSEEAYAVWLEDTAGRSCFAADVTPAATDRILTLSTCTYEAEDVRFVVAGILRQPETE